MKKDIILLIGSFAIIVGGVLYLVFNKKDMEPSNSISNEKEIAHTETVSMDYLYTKPEDLYREANLVIVAKYNKDLETVAIGNGLAQTTSNFTIIKTLKGSYEGKNIDINYNGGTLTLEQYIKTQTAEQLEKKGLSDISEAEAKKLYVSYVDKDAPINFDAENNEYVIFLKLGTDNEYHAASNGYSILNKQDNKLYDYITKEYKAYEFVK